MENTTAYSGLSKKEIEKARRTYRKSVSGRPKGFILWLIAALIWAGFGYLAFSVAEFGGTDDPTGVLIGFFGVPAVLLLVPFFVGNSRSIKKHQKWCAEVSQMDPALTEMFRMELVNEKAEEKRKEIERQREIDEQFKADMRDLGKDVKELGKLIVEDIKADIEDAWYDD